MDSLDITRILLGYGFRVTDEKAYAVGYVHPTGRGDILYVKKRGAKVSASRGGIQKQPLVLHPKVLELDGFSRTRAASGANNHYKSTSLSLFPKRAGEITNSGVAVDVRDENDLRELLTAIGYETKLAFIDSAQGDFHDVQQNSEDARRDYDSAQEDIDAAANLPDNATERQAVIAARRGQGRFRQALIDEWGACAVTGCKNLALLRASHIKPWRDCNNAERLSRDNGLLLSAHIDAAFDLGIISFSSSGEILINQNKLSDSDAAALGIHHKMRLRKIRREHLEYLSIHRASFSR